MREMANPSDRKPWRIFCAIELPADVQTAVLDHIRLLKNEAANSRATWARETNLHLTIKFAGNVQQDRVSRFSACIARAASAFAPFSIRLEGTGVFPARGAARVLWIGVNDESGNLQPLQTAVEEECEKENFSREDRAFHPHLTLARVRNPEDGFTLAKLHKKLAFKPIAFLVNELQVIRSELSPQGSKYTIVSNHRLGSAD